VPGPYGHEWFITEGIDASKVMAEVLVQCQEGPVLVHYHQKGRVCDPSKCRVYRPKEDDD
jgi:hypothetical protein